MDEQHVAALEAELVALKKRTKIVEDKLNEVEFGSFTQGASGIIAMDIKPRRHAAVMALAASLVDTLGKATNYVAIRIDHSSGPLEAIVQRVGPRFITPHQGRTLAEAEVTRLLGVCAANGINESTTLAMCGAFVPAKDDAAAKEQASADAYNNDVKSDPTPWCMLDINEDPNVLYCERCGDRQALPEWKTSTMIKAMIAAFSGVHADCVEVSSANSSNIDNDDDGAE